MPQKPHFFVFTAMALAVGLSQGCASRQPQRANEPLPSAVETPSDSTVAPPAPVEPPPAQQPGQSYMNSTTPPAPLANTAQPTGCSCSCSLPAPAAPSSNLPNS